MNGETPEPLPGESPAELTAPKAGDRIGTYRLRRLIGEGASGRVFEVEHASLGRRDAMKILSPEHAARPGSIKRLFAEARAVNRVRNPHIVEVTDLIEAERPGGVNAIVMELLEGESLAARIERGRLEASEYLPILIQVADALESAHVAGIVHRDLKPENIYLARRGVYSGFVKLLDFGLAKSLVEEPAVDDGRLPMRRTHGTAEGAFVGTPAYASPEQASGKAVDLRTDIYSFGVILYELLCGRLPFEGKNFGDYLVKHLTEPPPRPPAEAVATPLGRALAALARQCLQKDPAKRVGSAAELRRALETLLAEVTRPELKRPSRLALAWAAVTATVREGPTVRGVPRRLLVAGAAGLGLAGLALAVASSPSAIPRPATRAGRATEPARGAATQVVPMPTPTPAPPPDPSPVAITFESEPPGAAVKRSDTHELLGTTPLVWQASPSPSPVEVELRARGHAAKRVVVLLDADQVVLVRLPRGRRAASGGASATGSASGAASSSAPSGAPGGAASAGTPPSATPPAAAPSGAPVEQPPMHREGTLDPFR